jgi:hypothetical protein
LITITDISMLLLCGSGTNLIDIPSECAAVVIRRNISAPKECAAFIPAVPELAGRQPSEQGQCRLHRSASQTLLRELVQLDTDPDLHQPRDRHIYLVWTSLNTSLKRGMGWEAAVIPCLWNYRVDSDPLLVARRFSQWRGSGT